MAPWTMLWIKTKPSGFTSPPIIHRTVGRSMPKAIFVSSLLFFVTIMALTLVESRSQQQLFPHGSAWMDKNQQRQQLNEIATASLHHQQQHKPRISAHRSSSGWTRTLSLTLLSSSNSWRFAKSPFAFPRGGGSESDSSTEEQQQEVGDNDTDDNAANSTQGTDPSHTETNDHDEESQEGSISVEDDVGLVEVDHVDIDLDNEEQNNSNNNNTEAMDVRGGSSNSNNEPSNDDEANEEEEEAKEDPSGLSCTGTSCEKEETINADNNDNIDDRGQQGDNNNLASHESVDESQPGGSSVSSVPPGGSSEPGDRNEKSPIKEDEAEATNGHTAVAEPSEEASEQEEEKVKLIDQEQASNLDTTIATETVVAEEATTESSETSEPAKENDVSDDQTEAIADSAPAEVVQVAKAEDNAVEASSPPQVDDETAKILIRELKYRRYEVRGMQPSIAAIVVEKRLRRPQEGIPPNWYVDSSHIPPMWRQQLEDWLPKLVLPVLAGAVGISLYILQQQQQQHVDRESNKQQLVTTFKPLQWLKSIKPVRVNNSTTPTVAAAATIASADASSDESSLSSTEATSVDASSISSPADGVSKDGHVHPHSIQPYVHDKPPKEEELDESWLDKILTGISKRIKGFFGKTIG